MRRVDGIHLRVIAEGEQKVIIAEQSYEGHREEETDALSLVVHE